MDQILKLEEAGLLLLSVFLFYLTDYSWWVFPLLLLVPDLSMAGYLLNSVAGAILYNLFHHKGLAVLAYMAGSLMTVPELELAGIILLGHASMDRIFGFGLKYPDSFHHTHLGIINKKDETDLHFSNE